jgi:hypothetical protein
MNYKINLICTNEETEENLTSKAPFSGSSENLGPVAGRYRPRH